MVSKLGRVAGFHEDVARTEAQVDDALEDVEPVTALMDARLGKLLVLGDAHLDHRAPRCVVATGESPERRGAALVGDLVG